MVDWLVENGWLVSGLGAWLVDELGSLIGWLIGWLVDWLLLFWLVGWLAG